MDEAHCPSMLATALQGPKINWMSVESLTCAYHIEIRIAKVSNAI